MVFYTSDLHLGHTNVIRHCDRPFSNADEMDAALIKNWNDKVHRDDTVYVVGDFLFRAKRPAEEYLSELKGKKHLIVGNHDKEYVELWQEYYPFENEWYFVGVSENKPGSHWKFRGLSVIGRREHALIVNADLKNGVREETWYKEEPAIELCKLLLPAVEHSIEMLRDGTYNAYVAENLPYPHRTGMIKRSVVYAADPEYKDREFEGLKPEQIQQYRDLITSGANDEMKIGRLEKMTANDFFRACELGYKAIGKKTEGFSPVQLYLRYSDGRDEGLTGEGHGLKEGPGIDFDDPAAWEEWYFGPHGGGHPWEVVPGGNSTHMDLFVRHDRHTLGWKVRTGEMTQEEADQHPVGFYYQITGKHRPMESVNFYLTLHDAGLPVQISDAEEILARFDASDYIGIVPHSKIPKYCESMFPKEYGRVIDFMHVYEEDLEKYKGDITFERRKQYPSIEREVYQKGILLYG